MLTLFLTVLYITNYNQHNASFLRLWGTCSPCMHTCELGHPSTINISVIFVLPYMTSPSGKKHGQQKIKQDNAVNSGHLSPWNIV